MNKFRSFSILGCSNFIADNNDELDYDEDATPAEIEDGYDEQLKFIEECLGFIERGEEHLIDDGDFDSEFDNIERLLIDCMNEKSEMLLGRCFSHVKWSKWTKFILFFDKKNHILTNFSGY